MCRFYIVVSSLTEFFVSKSLRLSVVRMSFSMIRECVGSFALQCRQIECSGFPQPG